MTSGRCGGTVLTCSAGAAGAAFLPFAFAFGFALMGESCSHARSQVWWVSGRAGGWMGGRAVERAGGRVANAARNDAMGKGGRVWVIRRTLESLSSSLDFGAVCSAIPHHLNKRLIVRVG